MKRQLRDYRIPALGLVIVATGFGCATDTALSRPQLSTQETVTILRANQFAALNRYYSDVQAGYDHGSVSDERLRSAFRHFYDSSPDLAARYATWVNDMPNSYVAHLARAIYYIRVGEASRGNMTIAYTSGAQLRGMDSAFATASSELEKSVSLEKKPLLSVFYQLDIGKFEGDAAHNRALLQNSLAIDRKNFIVREMYMQTLQTAWGGSTEQLKAFVADNRTAGLSTRQMKDLESLVFADEAWVDEVDNENYKRAATEYLEAAKLSDDEVCLLCAGKVLVKAEQFPAAAKVLTQYLARDPESMEALKLRVYVYFKLGRTTDERCDYQRLANLGDAYSEYMIGTMYLVGQNGLAKDREAGIRWLRRAAAQGDPSATKLLPVALDKRYTIVSRPGGVAAIRSPTS